MKTYPSTARRMFHVATWTALVSITAACSSSKNDEAPSTADASTPDASAPGAATPADPNTIYGRIGGREGIHAIASAILDAAMMDPVLASYFGAGDPKPVLKATRAQDIGCLVLQLGQAAGGPEVYPGQLDDGFRCRSMAEAHAGLAIDSAVFDRFIGVAAGVLKTAHVADGDIATLGLALLGLKDQIVTAPPTTDGAAGPYRGH